MSSGRAGRAWTWRETFWVWIVLPIPFAVTGFVACIPLGSGNAIVSISIGALKAVLIALFFMYLTRANGTVWLASLAGFVFLFTRLLPTFGDYTTRLHW